MRVLLISDVHANRAALEAVLRTSPAIDAIWNLGDTVGYGPRPRACLDLLMEPRMDPVLAGNHDLAAIGVLDRATFNPVARAALEWTATQLTEEDQDRLRRLPSITETAGYTLAHASPREPVWEYLVDPTTATENFASLTTDVGFVGHSHVALYAVLSEGATDASLDRFEAGDTIDLSRGRFLINPGSVGQPRDGDPRAAFAVLDTAAGHVTAHRVAYDIACTQRQMEAAGLPRPLIKRLASGR